MALGISGHSGIGCFARDVRGRSTGQLGLPSQKTAGVPTAHSDGLPPSGSISPIRGARRVSAPSGKGTQAAVSDGTLARMAFVLTAAPSQSQRHRQHSLLVKSSKPKGSCLNPVRSCKNRLAAHVRENNAFALLRFATQEFLASLLLRVPGSNSTIRSGRKKERTARSKTASGMAAQAAC